MLVADSAGLLGQLASYDADQVETLDGDDVGESVAQGHAGVATGLLLRYRQTFSTPVSGTSGSTNPSAQSTPARQLNRLATRSPTRTSHTVVFASIPQMTGRGALLASESAPNAQMTITPPPELV